MSDFKSINVSKSIKSFGIYKGILKITYCITTLIILYFFLIINFIAGFKVFWNKFKLIMLILCLSMYILWLWTYFLNLQDPYNKFSRKKLVKISAFKRNNVNVNSIWLFYRNERL